MTAGPPPVQVVCTKCGHANTTEDKFCGVCGAYLEWNSKHIEHKNPVEYRAGRVDEGPRKSILTRVREAVLDPDEDAPRIAGWPVDRGPAPGAPDSSATAGPVPFGPGPTGADQGLGPGHVTHPTPASGGFPAGGAVPYSAPGGVPASAPPPDPAARYPGAPVPGSLTGATAAGAAPAGPPPSGIAPPAALPSPAPSSPAVSGWPVRPAVGQAPAWGRAPAPAGGAAADEARRQAEEARRLADAAQAARIQADAEYQARLQAEKDARQQWRNTTETELGQRKASEAAHASVLAAQQRARAESDARARAESEARVRQEAAAKAAAEAASRAADEAGEQRRLSSAQAELAELEARAATTNDPTAKARYAAQIDAARERARQAARSAEVARTVRIDAEELAQLRQEANLQAQAGYQQSLAAERTAKEAEASSSKAEIELRSRTELETKARMDAEARMRQEEARRQQAEIEAKRRREEDERSRLEFEERQRRAAELLAQPLGPVTGGAGPQAMRPGQAGPVPYQGVGAMPIPAGSGYPGYPGAAGALGAGDGQGARGLVPADQQSPIPALPPQATNANGWVVGAVGPERPKIRAGDRICGECGVGNDPDRNFCRVCGTSLDGAQVQQKLPWYRRLWVSLTQRKPKTYKAGDRPDPSRKKRARRRFWSRIRWTVAIVCAVLLLIGFAVPEYRRALNEAQFKARRNVMAFINPKYYAQKPSGAKCSSAVEGKEHDPSKLTDGFSNTYWLSAPNPERGVGQTCTLWWNTYVTLRGSFWHTGAGGETYDQHPAPIKILLNYSNGEQQTLDLEAKAAKQRRDIKEQKYVAWVRITVLEVSPNGDTSVAMSEVEFFGQPANKSIHREPPPPVPA